MNTSRAFGWWFGVFGRRRDVSEARPAETQGPGRIDRLPWSRWHTLVIFALGVTWVLDGIEVSIAGNIADALTNPETGMGFSAGQIGTATGIYIAGACTGGVCLSYLTDRSETGRAGRQEC